MNWERQYPTLKWRKHKEWTTWKVFLLLHDNKRVNRQQNIIFLEKERKEKTPELSDTRKVRIVKVFIDYVLNAITIQYDACIK